MTEQEGYIKFKAHWKKGCFPIDQATIAEINTARSKLIKKGWLGVLSNDVGFGNISIRIGFTNQFIITGSATGGIAELEQNHFALVEKFNIEKNQLWCKGLTIASSESLTHAIIYQTNPGINAVIHIHAEKLWAKHIGVLPTSSKKAAYGTPKMAESIASLFEGEIIPSGVFIMGGHKDGLIAFGYNLTQVLHHLEKL